MDVNVVWNDTEKSEPPDRKVLLVAGSLGIDLAMKIDGHWYFKCGDNWDQDNLEYWSNCTPTQWADFNYPNGQTMRCKQGNEPETPAEEQLRLFLEKDVDKGVAKLNLLAWM